jgi:DNA-binding MarR family transcriptional regulator
VSLGFLSTSPAPSDGRSILVQFTPRGRSLMQRSFELFADLEREYSGRLGARAIKARNSRSERWVNEARAHDASRACAAALGVVP